MRTLKVTLLLLFSCLLARAQDDLSLFGLQKKAVENYPLYKQKKINDEALGLKEKNISVAWMPQLFLNGQATWQSSTTEIPIAMPGLNIPSLDKDAYKLTLDISQTLYDGGLSKKQKELERASLGADQQQIEVELYKLKAQLNQLFFNVVFMQTQDSLLRLMRSDIAERLKKTEAGIKEGAGLESPADALKAEILKIDQQLIETDANRKAALHMLTVMCGVQMNDNVRLTLPEVSTGLTADFSKRPEFKYFSLQKSKLDASAGLLNARLMPRVSAFAQLGYGKPGLNMFANEFEPYAYLGARLTWNLWNWNQNRNDRSLLGLQQQVLDIQKQNLELTLKMNEQKDREEISKWEEMMKKDHEIIALKNKIAGRSATMLDNGVMTPADYISDVNAATQAKLNLAVHQIQLAMAKINYVNNTGGM